jgi:SnoaL-like domain
VEVIMTINALPAPVQRAIDAANSGESEGFLGCFTPDGAVNDWGRVFRGRDAIRAWSDAEFIGVRVALVPTAAKTNSDATVTISAQVGGDGFNGPSHFTFALSGDFISLMSITA